MNISPPIAWRDVPVGAVVLDAAGVPRAVVGRWENLGTHLFLLEGDPASHYFAADDPSTTRLVLLDTADAVANLRAAGFEVTDV